MWLAVVAGAKSLWSGGKNRELRIFSRELDILSS